MFPGTPTGVIQRRTLGGIIGHLVLTNAAYGKGTPTAAGLRASNHCILGVVKADLNGKNRAGAVADIGSREALDRFRKAAEAFTARATQSRETARQLLISEGIYTKSGKLAGNYR